MSNSVINVNDKNFTKEVIEAKMPVLVDFWAEWCGPCQALGPILAEVAKEYHNKVKFTKINVDENPEVPSKYSIKGIPTLLLIEKGEVVTTKIGTLSKKDLIDFIDHQINK